MGPEPERPDDHECHLPVVSRTAPGGTLHHCHGCGWTYRLHPIVRRWFRLIYP